MDFDEQLRLSSELGEKVGRVKRHELPDSVRPVINEYEDLIGDRDTFLWKWLHFLFPEITLSSVGPEYEQRVRDDKLLVSLFIVLLDDLAEKRMDRATFEEASKIPLDHQSMNFERDGLDTEYLNFAARAWNDFEERLKEGPRAVEFRDVFYFDLKQNMTSIEYSYLVNQNLDLASTEESKRYDSHNMMLFTYLDIDLIHSPQFDRDTLSLLRKAIGKAQRMARIGNWITTWERELKEGDYSSGIVAYALKNDVITQDGLYRLRNERSEDEQDEIIAAIKEHGVEEIFLRDWEALLAEAKEFEAEMESVDICSFLEGMETVMNYHMASRGLK